MNKCSDIMTRDIKFCTPQDSVENAARLMRSENVGPIPVVDSAQSKRLIGIITDRDITVKVIAEGRDARKTSVGDVMTPQPVSCREGDSLQNAISAMSSHQVRRIPIVDRDQRLIGIIAQADIATRVGDSEKTGEVVENISQ